MGDRQPEPNHRLAAVMRAAGMSNKALARNLQKVSQSDGGEPVWTAHGQVGRWLRGEIREPNLRNRQLATRILGEALGRPVSMEEIGYPDGSASLCTQAGGYQTNLVASVEALSQLTRADLQDGRGATELVAVPAEWGAMLLRWFMDGDDETVDPKRKWLPVSPWDVEAVRDARSMFSTYDYKFGGGRPKALVAKFLDSEVIPRLPTVSPHTEVGREFFQEAAALARLAGWTAYDTGAHGLAQRYLMQAFRLARAAGDKALCGRILAGMSHQANYLGHHQQAVDLARAAHQRAGGAATPTAMSLFFAMEARAHSAMQDGSRAREALSAAETWHGQRNIANDPDWITYFDEAELHAELAHCFRDLGEPQLATKHAALSINSSESMYVRSLSFCRTVLATGHFLNADLDEALKVASEVVDTAAHLKSARVLSYLNDFSARITRTHGADLRVQIFLKHVRESLPNSPRLAHIA